MDEAHGSVIEQSLSEAHDAITEIILDLEAIALTVKSMSQKFGIAICCFDRSLLHLPAVASSLALALTILIEW